MRKILLTLTVFIVIFSGIAFADDIPEPAGPINDLADCIKPEYRDEMAAIITELENKTAAEIAVVTIQSIAPYDEAQYARLIFDKWKIGKKGKDNGILLLLAVKERRWRIETGYGVEGILPDGLCGEIGRNYMVPYFKDGQYGKGLLYGTAAIAGIIAKEAKIDLAQALPAQSNISRKAESQAFMAIFLGLFFFLWNLPWPLFFGLIVSGIFAFVFLKWNMLYSIVIMVAYLLALLVRLFHWYSKPLVKRKNFFGPQTYGGAFKTSSHGWGSGGGGFGGGGFGGGGGGGGGAGGGF